MHTNQIIPLESYILKKQTNKKTVFCSSLKKIRNINIYKSVEPIYYCLQLTYSLFYVGNVFQIE